MTHLLSSDEVSFCEAEHALLAMCLSDVAVEASVEVQSWATRIRQQQHNVALLHHTPQLPPDFKVVLEVVQCAQLVLAVDALSQQHDDSSIAYHRATSVQARWPPAC